MGLRATICRNVSCIAIALLLVVSLTTAAQAQPLRQVITGDEIRAAGLMRLGDLVDLVDGWTVVSTDALRQRSDPLGDGVGADAGWELWVDGHPVDFDVLGTRMLNRLPVLLQDIDCVEVVRGPAIQTGPLTSQGRLHVHTHRPDEGVHGRGTYWTGNDTGDPGPFKYTRGGGHNVDRLGPDIEATGEGRQGWGWFRAQALTRIHFPTYPALYDRLREQLPTTRGGTGREYPKTEMMASAVQVRLEPETGRHDLWGAISELGDFVYLEPYLREVPAQSLFARLGARGHVETGRAFRVDYHAAATANQLSERSAAAGLDPFLRVVTYRAGLEARGRRTRLNARLGARVQHDVAEAFVPLSDPTYTIASFYAGAASRRGDLEPSVALQAQVDGRDVALQGRLATTLQRSGWSWTTWLGYDEHFFNDTHRLWLWTRRGYPLLDTLGVDYSLAEEYSEHRVLRMETALHLRLDTAWTVEAGAFLRDHRGLALQQRTLTRYDEEWRYFEGATTLADGAGGTLVGGFASTRFRWTPRLSQQFFASVQHPLRSGDLFTEAWRARPVFQARTRATFRAASTFTLHGSLSFRSRTRWPGLGRAAALSDGAYEAEVPAAVVVDAAATKWLWDGHLRGTVGVRNVLNDAYRQHPLGAALPLSLRIQVSAMF